MEARASVFRTGISKLFVGIVLVIVAVGFGILASYLAANVIGAAGTIKSVQSGPNSVTRHENSPEPDQQTPTAPDEAPPMDQAEYELYQIVK